MQSTQSDRGQFDSKIGFILAAAGSAVGIGNLVAFPVSASKNGGAAFLVVYLLFVFLICFPVMLAEMAIGRSSRKNPVGAYAKLSGGSSFWSKVGGLAVVTPFMIGVFYLVITMWILDYLTQVLVGNLADISTAANYQSFQQDPKLFIHMLAVLAIVHLILVGGVKEGIEKAARILMPTLIFMLIALIVFVLSLDHAVTGISFYLIPDFSKIDGSVLNAALNQAFFSLSLGMGILITYGSYLKKQDNLISSTRMVAIFDTSIAFLAGLLILPAIFVITPDIDIKTLSSSSIGLIFGTLPPVFLAMGDSVGYVIASILATVFFLLVFFAAITSLISIIEVPVSYLVDEKKFSRNKALIYVNGSIGLLAIMATASFGMSAFFTEFAHYGGGQSKSFFDLIIDTFYSTILPLVGMFSCIFAVYRWKKHNMLAEIAGNDPAFANSWFGRYISFALGTFIPIILLTIFINTVLQVYWP